MPTAAGIVAQSTGTVAVPGPYLYVQGTITDETMKVPTAPERQMLGHADEQVVPITLPDEVKKA